jgi:hypothetical protein
MKLNQLILCSLLGFAATQAMACYTVYDRSDRVVYQSHTPPVDMSRPLHETLPARFPGGHMIFNAAVDCPVISSVASGTGGPSLASNAPLLTDARTARALGLPHTVLNGGIVVVRPRDVSLQPGVTVVPSANTGSRKPVSGMVITEMRDPPMTMIQSSDGTIVSELVR